MTPWLRNVINTQNAALLYGVRTRRCMPRNVKRRKMATSTTLPTILSDAVRAADAARQRNFLHHQSLAPTVQRTHHGIGHHADEALLCRFLQNQNRRRMAAQVGLVAQ